jgi:hypothetical protein
MSLPEGLWLLPDRRNSPAPLTTRPMEIASSCQPEEQDMIRALCEACAADYDRIITTRNELRRKLWESFVPS